MQRKLNHIHQTDQEIFRQIDDAIRGERLFVNPNLHRKDIMNRFGLRRQHLNDILTAYSYRQSFPAYVNSIRMQEAERMIKEKPNMTISAMAQSIGLSMANFRGIIKRTYGVTPSKLKKVL